MPNIFGLSIHDFCLIFATYNHDQRLFGHQKIIQNTKIFFDGQKITSQSRQDRYNSLFSLGEVQGGGSELFDKMYNGEGNFTRGQFYYQPSPPIEFESGSYKIVGEMGTTHEAEIKIQIFAEQEEKALKETEADE